MQRTGYDKHNTQREESKETPKQIESRKKTKKTRKKASCPPARDVADSSTEQSIESIHISEQINTINNGNYEDGVCSSP